MDWQSAKDLLVSLGSAVDDLQKVDNKINQVDPDIADPDQ